jgi:hypothetical protein
MSMSGIRAVLIVCLVSLWGTAWGADAPAIPAGSRIGITNLVTNDLRHYHVGRSEVNSFLRTYRTSWGAADLIDDPLITALIGAGFQPVLVPASSELSGERDSWLIQKPKANRMARGAMKEFGRVMVEQDLAALVIVAPGANTDPEFDPRMRLGKLPSSTQGFGFSTSDEPDGVTKPLVFDFTQILLLVRTTDGPRLVLRDWGGGRLHDWPGFDPGANLKTLGDAQLAPLRPVLAEALNQRFTTRLLPSLKP